MPDIVRNVDFSHQRVKEAVAGMWDDFYVEGRPFGKLSIYKNDFVSWVPDEWTITEVNAVTQLLVDERNGILRMTPAGADNDGAQMQLGGSGDGETVGESWAPAAGKNLWFETRVRAVEDITQFDFFVGLHVEDTTIIAGKGSDYIGFKTDDGDALIDAEASAGSSASLEAGVVAAAAINTFYKLGFKVTGTSKIEYYVNDVLKATISSVPTALMKLSLAFLSGEATANTFDYDYVVIAQDR